MTSPKVLFVDDSRTIRDVARVYLKQNAEVTLAEDGFDAMLRMMESPPDILFIDAMMPRMDGYATCAMVRSTPALAGIPIVMVSSKDNAIDTARGIICGATAHINKPFRKQDLLEAMERHIINPA